MKKLLIQNHPYYFHVEIIESTIVKYHEILNINKTIPIEIYLYLNNKHPIVKPFIKYIKNKYPNIKFKKINDYDYYINCTVYPKDANKLDISTESNKKYIAHTISDKLENNPNVYFLTPLTKGKFFYADILPFSEEKSISNIPIYIIQGSFDTRRRNYSLLKKILDYNYQYDFKIKIIGRETKEYMPKLEKYKEKIILKTNLEFIDYHKEFQNAYCIIPLITKKSHPSYYTNKLTSSINYARGYKLKCLIDRDLQKIYNLKNVEIFNNIDDIVISFKKTLEEFYNFY